MLSSYTKIKRCLAGAIYSTFLRPRSSRLLNAELLTRIWTSGVHQEKVIWKWALHRSETALFSKNLHLNRVIKFHGFTRILTLIFFFRPKALVHSRDKKKKKKKTENEERPVFIQDPHCLQLCSRHDFPEWPKQTQLLTGMSCIGSFTGHQDLCSSVCGMRLWYDQSQKTSGCQRARSSYLLNDLFKPWITLVNPREPLRQVLYSFIYWDAREGSGDMRDISWFIE